MSGRYEVIIKYYSRSDRQTADAKAYFDYESETDTDITTSIWSSPVSGSKVFNVYSSIIDLGNVSKHFKDFENTIRHSGSFFDPIDLKVVSQAPRVPSASRGSELAGRLWACPRGRADWRRFQDLCKEIVGYCFCPPLGELEDEVWTEDGTERRDIIIQIPHDAQEFWKYVMLAHKSMAVIVDAKNYSEALPANQVVIASKYFRKKGISSFGIVISRCQISEGAKAEQKKLWVEDDKMILCLSDDDLLKMLELKEKGDDPAKVLDDALRKFRLSI